MHLILLNNEIEGNTDQVFYLINNVFITISLNGCYVFSI